MKGLIFLNKTMVKFSENLLGELATKRYSGMHYQVYLLLSTRPYTATQLATALGVSDTANIRKPLLSLLSDGFIEVDRVEGRNKFYKAVISSARRKNIQSEQGETIDKNQISLFDIKK